MLDKELIQLLVPGRAPVPALDLTDADGTHLRLTIAGPGIARLTPNGTGYDLSLSGTDAGTRIDLTGSGGDGRITLTGLNADSPFGSLAAPIASLTGVARFATVNTLNLGDIAAGAQQVLKEARADLKRAGRKLPQSGLSRGRHAAARGNTPAVLEEQLRAAEVALPRLGNPDRGDLASFARNGHS